MDKHPLTIFRKKHNLTLKQFAEAVGVKESTVCNWEKGRFRPKPNFMQSVQKFIESLEPGTKAVLLFYP